MTKNSEKSGRFKIPYWVISIILSMLSAFSVCLFLSERWMFATWTDLSLSELIYQIKAPVQGTNMELIYSWCLQCGLWTIVTFVVILAFQILLKDRKSVFWGRVITFILCIGMIAETLWVFDQKLEVREYLKNRGSYSTFIDENYVDPQSVSMTFPEKKRNLICIYLESMEVGYADEENGGSYEVNLIPQLTKISEENINFSGSDSILNGAATMNGTSWTMGALFATASGLPLLLPIQGNSMSTQDSFLPAVTCLGDILEDAGYTQVFACGSDATFGGRRLFYETHGDFDFRDLMYYRESGDLPEDYSVWWGFEDEKLITFTKQELTELAAKNEPFNYTMLTVDTHAEDGYFCEDCEDLYDGNQYANVISCSDQKVTELIEWIQEQSWYENTTVVLIGDHKTMDSDFWTEDSTGNTYTAYINPGTDIKNDTLRIYTPFDHFPTILASLGVEIEGDRLGLGTNLFSDEETLAEIYGVAYIDDEFDKSSVFMESITADLGYSEEEEEVINFITRCYFTCFNRYPEKEGVNYWFAQLTIDNRSAKEVITELSNTDEFNALNSTDEQVIRTLYKVFKDRYIDEAELNTWLNRMNAGEGKDTLIDELADSDEFKALCANYNVSVGNEGEP